MVGAALDDSIARSELDPTAGKLEGDAPLQDDVDVDRPGRVPAGFGRLLVRRHLEPAHGHAATRRLQLPATGRGAAWKRRRQRAAGLPPGPERGRRPVDAGAPVAVAGARAAGD